MGRARAGRRVRRRLGRPGVSEERSHLSRLTGPAVGALIVLCCLAGPILIAAAGTLTVGALFGLGAAAVVLLGLCLLLARRLRSGEGPHC